MRDITDFLYKNFDIVRLYGGNPPTDLAVDCPFCLSEDTHQHLHVSLHKQTCHCFRCDYSNTWTGLVMDVLGCSYAFALGVLYVAPNPGQDIRVAMETTSVSRPTKLRKEEFIYPDGYIPLGLPAANKSAANYAQNYMRRRGFGKRYWDEYQIGVYDSRVFIPIEYDFWQARAIFPWQSPKYMSPRTVDDSDVIFNHRALGEYDEVVVCEGALSAMAVGKNAIAIIGKNPTPKIARLLDSTCDRFIIAYESYAKSMLKLADVLTSRGRSVEIWEYPSGKDPADRVEPATKSNYDLKTKVSMLLSI